MQALWMVLAAFFFASMAVCVKFASAWFNSAEQVFYRGLLGMVFMFVLARGQGVSPPGFSPSPSCRSPPR